MIASRWIFPCIFVLGATATAQNLQVTGWDGSGQLGPGDDITGAVTAQLDYDLQPGELGVLLVGATLDNTNLTADLDLQGVLSIYPFLHWPETNDPNWKLGGAGLDPGLVDFDANTELVVPAGRIGSHLAAALAAYAGTTSSHFGHHNTTGGQVSYVFDQNATVPPLASQPYDERRAWHEGKPWLGNPANQFTVNTVGREAIAQYVHHIFHLAGQTPSDLQIQALFAFLAQEIGFAVNFQLLVIKPGGGNKPELTASGPVRVRKVSLGQEIIRWNVVGGKRCIPSVTTVGDWLQFVPREPNRVHELRLEFNHAVSGLRVVLPALNSIGFVLLDQQPFALDINTGQPIDDKLAIFLVPDTVIDGIGYAFDYLNEVVPPRYPFEQIGFLLHVFDVQQ